MLEGPEWKFRTEFAALRAAGYEIELYMCLESRAREGHTSVPSLNGP